MLWKSIRTKLEFDNLVITNKDVFVLVFYDTLTHN